MMRLLAGLVLALFSVGGAAESRSPDGVDKNDEPTMVLIGASYAKGWPLAKLAGYRIVNKGVGGEETRFTRERFREEVIASGADAVLIWGFINDIFRADRSKIDERVVSTRENLAWMAEQADSAGIDVVLATEVTMAASSGFVNSVKAVIGDIMGKSSYQDYINGHVMDVNGWLQQYASKHGFPVLDLQQVVAEDGGAFRDPEYATEDGSHITPEGYKVLTEYAKTSLTRGDVENSGK